MRSIGFNWHHAASVVSAVAITGCNGLQVRDNEIEAKTASATTRAQHMELAALYDERAAEERSIAGRHLPSALQERRIWDSLRRYQAYPRIPLAIRDHCDTLEALHSEQAASDSALAEAHRRMARAASE